MTLDGHLLLDYLLPAFVTGAVTLLGGLFTIVRWMGARIMTQLEARIAEIGDVARHTAQVDERLQQTLTELPTLYQRREDTLRLLEHAESRYQKAVDHVIAVLRERVQEAERRIAAMEGSVEEGKREYQRRDDAIREYTAMNAKLDRIWETMMEARHGR